MNEHCIAVGEFLLFNHYIYTPSFFFIYFSRAPDCIIDIEMMVEEKNAIASVSHQYTVLYIERENVFLI